MKFETSHQKARYELWHHFVQEFDLYLVESQLDDILMAVKDYQKVMEIENPKENER